MVTTRNLITFDTKDVNEQLVIIIIMKNKAGTLSSGSSQQEIFNVLVS